MHELLLVAGLWRVSTGVRPLPNEWCSYAQQFDWIGDRNRQVGAGQPGCTLGRIITTYGECAYIATPLRSPILGWGPKGCCCCLAVTRPFMPPPSPSPSPPPPSPSPPPSPPPPSPSPLSSPPPPSPLPECVDIQYNVLTLPEPNDVNITNLADEGECCAACRLVDQCVRYEFISAAPGFNSSCHLFFTPYTSITFPGTSIRGTGELGVTHPTL